MSEATVKTEEVFLGALLQRGLQFAAEAHRGQEYPSTGLPYLLHLSQVLGEVAAAELEAPSAEPALAMLCAVLHDTIEDCAVSHGALEARFGRAVADGVQALSKRPGLEKAAAMRDSLARIKGEPVEVWKVKLADRISNLQSPPAHWSTEKIARYKKEAELILSELGAASAPLAARLQSAIEAYPPA